MIMAIVVAVAGAATGRVVYSGEAEIAASTAALDAGDAREAIVRARRAAGWYVPGAPHVHVAYRRLTALAHAAEVHRRDDLALQAWRGVRAASIETRWIVAPHDSDRRQADAQIARLAAKVSGDVAPDATIARVQLEALGRQTAPRPLGVAGLLGGFVLVAAGLVLAARRGAGPAGNVDLLRARPGLVLAVVGVVFWLLSLWQA
jgi:hypothetical protein